ncbi:efflux RND transporter periplasmic adaptor subunit [Maricaulis sp.]|uniref:efflux RND transporter periplasmic adaptor subunit n=1 Tax=Maricaulis sp. TaxID=1486257 RepID=UPI003A8E21B0
MTPDKTDDALKPAIAEDQGNSLVPLATGTPPETSPTPPAQTKTRFALLAAIAGLVVMALAASWWGLASGGGTPVAVETLVAGPVERVLAVSGRTETDIHSDIRSRVSARVSEVRVNEGDTVSLGDELILLDASQQASQVRQAQAALDAARLRRQSAQADRDRAVRLGDTVSAVGLANAERDLALAIAEVERLQATLEQAQLSLPDYRITAPIAGVVLNRSVDPGDLVTPEAVLMRVANTDDLYVEVQIDEIYADRIRIGQPALLQLAGQTGSAPGRVFFVASEVDALTGSLRVKLAFDTVPDAQIGLTTIANILVDRVEEAVTVPRNALVTSGSGAAVFVVRDGRARLTPISYVDWPADRVEVISGLGAGERIVLSPDGIEDGQALTVRDGPAASG